MKTVPLALASLAFAAACAETAPAVRSDEPVEEAPARHEEAPIPPERMDEVQSIFRRKTTSVQSCYTDEMERNGNQKIEGDVALSMTLATNGKAIDVKVDKSTLKSPTIEQCVIDQVKSWDFGPLPSRGYFSWTFNFKPAY